MVYKKRSNAAAIASCLQKKTIRKLSWQLRWKAVCGSTEIYLTNWLAEKPLSRNQPMAIFASRQTHGVGQRGRFWSSPRGGVWLSAALPCLADQQSSSLFGLAVALSLCERLELLGIQAKIKWPNDLLVFDKKLAGFLPRLIYRGDRLRQARIGIGMNILNKTPVSGISLSQVLRTKNINLEKWSVEVLLSLERAMDLFETEEPFYLEVEKRLWDDKVIDPISGELWSIEGLDNSGGLKLIKGKRKMIWNRWR